MEFDNTPGSNPDDNQANRDAGIPSPRPAPDDNVENLPKTGSGQPVWWYDQKRKRGIEWRFTGHVTRIGGAEGERLRGDLAAILRDLLGWAAQQSETESHEDGDVA